MTAALRRFGVVFAVLALVGCFDFKDDLTTCALPGHACATGSTDSGTDAGADAGVDASVPARASYCTSPAECLSGSCIDGCCDQACTGVTDIVAGYGTSCAVVTDGTVRCWGENRQGQALGELTADGGNALVPMQVRNVASARKVVAGDEFACALLADQTVTCWGRSAEGQLGRGAVDGGPQLAAPVSGLSGAVDIAAGSSFACAIVANGQVRCWGYNFQGELGDGTNTDRYAPVPVCNSGTSESGCAPLTGALELTAARDSACVRVSAGAGKFAARCWGNNASDQLGPGNPYTRNSPNTVQGLPDSLAKVVLGPGNACAVIAGQLWCWGANLTSNDEWVLLGRGPDAGAQTPDAGPVCQSFDAGGCTPLTGVVSAGTGDDFGCALVGDRVFCWGADYLDRLGTELPGTTDVAVPADRGAQELGGVKLLQSGVETISVGASHSCARLQGGSAVCWGSNVNGELGINDAREFNAATGPSRPVW